MYSDLSKEERYRLWYDSQNNVYYNKYQQVLAHFGSIEAIFELARSKKLTSEGLISDMLLKKLIENASEAYIDELIAELIKHNVKAYTLITEGYPDMLKDIYDPPAVLYCLGNLKSDIGLSIAIIGSRSASPYGIRVARVFSRQLANEGVCIISGLAKGIDGEASRGALKSNSDYPTIAVLGTNILNIFPASNSELAQSIMERGAVISEYAPHKVTNRYTFPQRNRIISGLSNGVLVVEAAIKSGTNITIDYAHEQGRNVYSLPGRITDELSAGTNALIRHGAAKPVFGINDILEDYGKTAVCNEPKIMPSPSEMAGHAKKKSPDSKISAAKPKASLTHDELLVIQALNDSPKNFDEICNVCEFSISYLISVLTELEFSGIIRQSHGRVYELIKPL
ncbi:MAG: DNA-processing protein DprA [Clostridia bacterium]|nr:DNA-processing protein DprA [Clostridia bacterium]